MKIFGWEIGKQEKKEDAIPQIDIISPGTKSPSTIKAVVNPVLIYQQNGSNGFAKATKRRNIFEPPEYDLYEISRIADVDSYVRQAFKKQVGLFLKEGFDYVGRNKRAVKYIRTRFGQISMASGIPHNELIRRLANNLMAKSNAFLIKVRDVDSSGGKVRNDINDKKLDPVAAYFPVAPETMTVDTDGNGKPRAWRQRLPNGQWVDFKPENVIHFTFDRKEGFLFGTPIITPVIDDIRALRRIEENIELLIYKHLFPLFQYKVGTEAMPAGITQDGKSEIDILKQEIQNMPSEGGIVTSERHEIRSIGAESKALRAESYLAHFKLRVFAGLGMSAVDFGEAATANKATAVELSRALIDNVKDFQDSFEAQFNEFVINELLLESNFSEDMMAEENKVEIVFREIDIDKQIKVENHAIDVFIKNGMTWDEVREIFGKDPIMLPENEEEYDASQYPEWARTHWKLFQEPEKLISAVDENYLKWATARSIGTSAVPGDIQASTEEAQAMEKIKAKAKVAARPKTRDSFLTSDYNTVQEVVLHHWNTSTLGSKLKMISNQMIEKLRARTMAAFINGLGTDISSNLITKVSIIRREIHDRSSLLIHRLLTDIQMSINKRVDTSTQNDRISNIFDAFRYRLSQIEDVQLLKANNLGRIMRAMHGGIKRGKFVPGQKACDTCKDKMNKLTELHYFSLENVLPHHPSCECSLEAAE